MATVGHPAEMPFLEHLEELRWRILKSLVALVAGVVVAFSLLLKFDIILILERPILPFLNGHQLVYTHPADPFKITMSMAFALGAIFASPVLIWQVWGFLSPALYKHEKKVIIPVLIFGAILFLAGVSLAFFGIIPITLKMFYSIQTASLTPMITAGEYFDFVVSLSLVLGAVFELPIAVLALTALGIVTPQFLNRFRRHAVVVCLVASAFITPGQDPFSLLAIAVPLYLLFELSVVCSFVVYRRKQRREESRLAEESGVMA
ncbi:MAG TPA: twin-arginine translocase subunit TatC [Gemmatimonadaceae bacterium]|nr:MAG: twin arginine-targeting protein translocase TatC [Gemmatimonadetes bacterium SCN 70-22]HMN07172.1 twin-arginine translocase subunit TatC [Gemmatimonadaceae bacterium]